MCGEHLQELYTVYLTRFLTDKIALPLQVKTKEGRGPQTPAAKSLYRSIFKKSRHLGLESVSCLVHAPTTQTSVNRPPSTSQACGEFNVGRRQSLNSRITVVAFLGNRF